MKWIKTSWTYIRLEARPKIKVTPACYFGAATFAHKPVQRLSGQF